MRGTTNRTATDQARRARSRGASRPRLPSFVANTSKGRAEQESAPAAKTHPAGTARGGGTCYWSNIHTGCSGGQTYLPYWPKIRRGKGYASLCCTIADGAARLDVFFQDGDHVTLTPKHGYLI